MTGQYLSSIDPREAYDLDQFVNSGVFVVYDQGLSSGPLKIGVKTNYMDSRREALHYVSIFVYAQYLSLL